jgi:hypothetical protein
MRRISSGFKYTVTPDTFLTCATTPKLEPALVRERDVSIVI